MLQFIKRLFSRKPAPPVIPAIEFIGRVSPITGRPVRTLDEAIAAQVARKSSERRTLRTIEERNDVLREQHRMREKARQEARESIDPVVLPSSWGSPSDTYPNFDPGPAYTGGGAGASASWGSSPSSPSSPSSTD